MKVEKPLLPLGSHMRGLEVFIIRASPHSSLVPASAFDIKYENNMHAIALPG